MKSRITLFISIIILTFFSMIIFSCTTGQPGVAGDEDSFFSESNQGSQSKSDLSEEEEVLRLLGITDDEAQVQPVTPAQTTSNSPSGTNWEVLEKEVDRLENEINKKDRELENLKDQLDTKDTEIESKEKSLGQATYSNRVYSSMPSGTTVPKTTAGTMVTATDVNDSFKNSYDEALALYHARRYRESIEIFNQLLNLPTTSYSDNCQYWKGECYYGLGDFNQALLEFQKVFTFEKANKYPDAQLKIGRCYESMGQYDQARNEYQKLIDEYPDSDYVPRAQSYLSNL